MKYRKWLIPWFWALNLSQMMIFIISIYCDESRWTNSRAVPQDHVEHHAGSTHKNINWHETYKCAEGASLQTILICIANHGKSKLHPDAYWTIASQVFGALNLLLTLIQALLIGVELQ